MPKTRAAKNRANKRNNKKHKLSSKTKKLKHKQHSQQPRRPLHDHDPIPSGRAAAEADDDLDLSAPDIVERLLEPCTKEQVVALLADAADADAGLLARIRAVAERDVAHRKLFVHGLAWDATREGVIETFSPYGPIEECNVVVDKATGRAKGYGFVVFASRASAVKALKQPQKKIGDRMTSCQLASLGPVAGASAAGAGDVSQRRIYISNVHADVAPDKLKDFFAQFGEIETGPIGFDSATGKSRGFAMFIYKTQEGLKNALEEPHKMFEGRTLHCKLANEPGQKGKGPAFVPSAGYGAASLLGTSSQPVMTAAAAAQNMALYGQSPAYAMLLGQNPLLAAAALNPTVSPAALGPAAAATALNSAAGLLASQGQAMGGLGGIPPSLLGMYGSQGYAGLQGLQPYQGSHLGQSSSSSLTGSYGRFSS